MRSEQRLTTRQKFKRLKGSEVATRGVHSVTNHAVSAKRTQEKPQRVKRAETDENNEIRLRVNDRYVTAHFSITTATKFYVSPFTLRT